MASFDADKIEDWFAMAQAVLDAEFQAISAATLPLDDNLARAGHLIVNIGTR